MKKLRVLLAIVAILAFTITGCSTSSGGGNIVSLTILQTSDIHDHAGGYGSAAYLPWLPVMIQSLAVMRVLPLILKLSEMR